MRDSRNSIWEAVTPGHTAQRDWKMLISHSSSLSCLIEWRFFTSFKANELSGRASSSATPESQPVAKQAWKAIYYVQLGIFKNEINAAALTERFKKKGYNAFVMKSPARGNGTLYRVLIGRFEDRHESEELAAKIGRKE